MGTRTQNMLSRIALFVLAICTIAFCQELSENEYESLWNQFVSEHSKTYKPHEVMNRFTTFKDNVNFIVDHNKNHAARLGYTVGVNQFADMTNAEFKRAYTGFVEGAYAIKTGKLLSFSEQELVSCAGSFGNQ